MRTILPLLALAATLLAPLAAAAQPARIIILRHAEKQDDYALCDIGTQRAHALAAQLLGRGASQSVFAPGQGPDAILAITLHPLETITPAAQSWNAPVVTYAIIPEGSGKGPAETELENRRTQEAAHDLLTDPRYAGKTVLMTWEHNHIAKAKLEQQYPGQPVTLRQLLHLDQLAGVPPTWPDENYDFLWIVDYAPGNPTPTAFHMVRETFTAPFDTLPANDWNTPEPTHIAAGCLK